MHTSHGTHHSVHTQPRHTAHDTQDSSTRPVAQHSMEGEASFCFATHTSFFTLLSVASQPPTAFRCLLVIHNPHSGTKVVDSAVLRFPKAVTHFSPGVRAWVRRAAFFLLCIVLACPNTTPSLLTRWLTRFPFVGGIALYNCRATSIAPSRRPASPTCFWRGIGSRVSPTVPMGSARRGRTSQVGPLIFHSSRR